MPGMKVLVVGGAGYIGSHCVRQLAEAGHQPAVLDDLSLGHRQAVDESVPFYQGRLGDGALLDEIFQKEKTGLVMHFAAFASVPESVRHPLRYYDNNIAQPVRLLERMVENGVKQFVFSSSCATYGVPEKLPMTEEAPQRPISPYGQTKLDLENMLRACARAEGLSFASFRYFNAAGAAEDGRIGEDHRPETHLIPLAIQAARESGPPLKIFGRDYPTPDGTCLRDYIHVDDLCRAHIAVFPQLKEPGRALFYNLGTGEPHSVREVIQAVEETTGLKVPAEEADRRPGDPPALYADPAKAQKELGWQIRHPDLEPIVETAWRWHREHPRGYAG